MNIYHYCRNTGEYLGTDTARHDPIAGTPVLPAYATSIAPPETDEGQVAIFDVESGEWSVVADFRGQPYWDAEGVYCGEVQSPGPLAEGCTLTAPEPNPEQQATTIRGTRNALLAASDWTQLADCPLDATDVALWATYRQALRDVPQQAGFPKWISWPDQPM